MKMTRSLISAVPIMLVFLIGTIPGHIHAQETTPEGVAPIASGTGGVVEGTVMEVETHTLVVEKHSGENVRVPMPGKSGKSSSDFSKGDYIEASISPEGITTSIRNVVDRQKHLD